MDDAHSGNATETLDRVRIGGSNLVLICNHRIAEVKKALDHGRFKEAWQAAASLTEKLGHLANAEGRLGVLSAATIIKAGDMETGMTTPDAGRVISIEPCSNCGREECENVVIGFDGGGVVTVHRDQEMVVANQ